MLLLFLNLTFCYFVLGENATHQDGVQRRAGLNRPSSEFKVVGGKPASISSYPYQISLQYYDEHNCGGSILNPTTILTSAHCVDGSEPSEFTVRAGSSLHGSGGQVVGVSKIIQHPKWNFDDSNEYDAAILKLSSPLTLGLDVGVALMTLLEPSPGTICTASGWGYKPGSPYKPGSGYSDIWNQLQSVDMPIISRRDCKKEYATINSTYWTVSDRDICAGSPAGEKDAIQMDWNWLRGGPLIRKTNLFGLPPPPYVQVGIVSWQYFENEKGYPTVYTSIASVRDFIFANFI